MHTVRGLANSFKIFIGFFIIVLMLSGCATKIKVNMLQPAQYHEASLTKTIAVLPFGGPEGRAFTAEIEGVLAGIGIDDKPYFTLVDHTSLDKTINEMQLSPSGMVDQEAAVKIGKLVGAQGIYTGVVIRNSYDDSPYYENRSTCVQYEQKRDKDGNLYRGTCISWRQYNAKCIRRVANFAVSPKLVDVATGKIIYSRDLSASANSSGCDDARPAQGGNELLEKTKEAVKKDFRHDIAPYYVTKEISLMDSKEGIESAEARDKLKRGLEYADKGRMDSACALWREARSSAPNSYALLYNLGVCAESRGDYDAASVLYKEAAQRLGKANEDITLALDRMETAIKDRARLKEQLKNN